MVSVETYNGLVGIGAAVARERDLIREQRNRAERDRDRYRRALAEIAALPRPQFQTERTWREIALEALRDG